MEGRVNLGEQVAKEAMIVIDTARKGAQVSLHLRTFVFGVDALDPKGLEAHLGRIVQPAAERGALWTRIPTTFPIWC